MTILLVTTPHLLAHDLAAMILAVVLVVNSPQWSQKSHERWVLIVAIAILYAGYFCLLMLHYRTGYIIGPTLVVFALAALSLARRTTGETLSAQKQVTSSATQSDGHSDKSQFNLDAQLFRCGSATSLWSRILGSASKRLQCAPTPNGEKPSPHPSGKREETSQPFNTRIFRHCAFVASIKEPRQTY